MSIYDLIMLAVLVGATVFGLWKGIAWQLASLAAVVISSVVAMQFGDVLAPYLSSQAPWNKFLAMLVLFLFSSFSIWILYRFVRQTIDRIQLTSFDRQLGALFGAAKGALVCVVITFFAVTLSADSRSAVLQSHSGYYISVFIHEATPIMPAEARQVLGPYLEKLDRGLDPRYQSPPSPTRAPLSQR
jgi:membrane protein required for colicin V production